MHECTNRGISVKQQAGPSSSSTTWAQSAFEHSLQVLERSGYCLSQGLVLGKLTLQFRSLLWGHPRLQPLGLLRVLWGDEAAGT